MADDPILSRAEALSGDVPIARAGALLTTAEYAALVHELEALRSKHRAELADHLRVARAFGGSADSDDLLTVLEEAAIDEARIARLEEQIRRARVVDVDSSAAGAAGLGATVRVVDDAGRETEYELVGRRGVDAGRHEVTPASPVGEALLGARAGDEVSVELPSGRVRALRVLAVRYPDAAEAA